MNFSQKYMGSVFFWVTLYIYIYIYIYWKLTYVKPVGHYRQKLTKWQMNVNDVTKEYCKNTTKQKSRLSHLNQVHLAIICKGLLNDK